MLRTYQARCMLDLLRVAKYRKLSANCIFVKIFPAPRSSVRAVLRLHLGMLVELVSFPQNLWPWEFINDYHSSTIRPLRETSRHKGLSSRPLPRSRYKRTPQRSWPLRTNLRLLWCYNTSDCSRRTTKPFTSTLQSACRIDKKRGEEILRFL